MNINRFLVDLVKKYPSIYRDGKWILILLRTWYDSIFADQKFNDFKAV